MAITKLTVENFKSFDKLEVELRPFNIVVGSNASGKSNFLDVFRFLRDIADDSLENAIGVRGGAEAVENFKLDENKVLRFNVETNDVQRRLVDITDRSMVGIESDQTTYEFSIQFDESDTGFHVVTDKLAEHFTTLELFPGAHRDGQDANLWIPIDSSLPYLTPGIYVELRRFSRGKILHQRQGGSIYRSVELYESIPFEDFWTDRDNIWDLDRPQSVMMERFPRLVFLSGGARALGYVSVYDFDPRKAQLAVPPSGSRELDEDAENLSVVLREILRRPESKKRLINLVSVLLPFVHDLDVEAFGFGQLMTTLTERFSDKRHRLPAFFASDGTVACLALVVALYFQDNAVAVFEEPDRHIHPHLASRVMQMMNEVTERTQVIVTTHNPEMLRHANLDDLLLVTRNSDGHSEITRPADSEVLSHFLQNELGVDDLFVQNLLAL